MGQDFFDIPVGAAQVLRNAVALAPGSDDIDLMVYVQYAREREVNNVLGAIPPVLGSRVVRESRLDDASELSSWIDRIEVFVIAEQQLRGSEDFAPIAAAWETMLRGFLARGGIVVVMNSADMGWRLVQRPSLVSMRGVMLRSGGVIAVSPAASGSPLAVGVTPYDAPLGTAVYDVSAGGLSMTPILVTGSEPVVLDIAF